MELLEDSRLRHKHTNMGKSVSLSILMTFMQHPHPIL